MSPASVKVMQVPEATPVSVPSASILVPSGIPSVAKQPLNSLVKLALRIETVVPAVVTDQLKPVDDAWTWQFSTST
jgi:hypothetical protein